jgi:hypothetical protein
MSVMPSWQTTQVTCGYGAKTIPGMTLDTSWGRKDQLDQRGQKGLRGQPVKMELTVQMALTEKAGQVALITD